MNFALVVAGGISCAASVRLVAGGRTRIGWPLGLLGGVLLGLGWVL